MITQIADDTIDRRAADQMTLAPLKLWSSESADAQAWCAFKSNLENYLSSAIRFISGNGIARKILIWRNAKISCNSLLLGGFGCAILPSIHTTPVLVGPPLAD